MITCLIALLSKCTLATQETKAKGGELTPEQKQDNRELSQQKTFNPTTSKVELNIYFATNLSYNC